LHKISKQTHTHTMCVAYVQSFDFRVVLKWMWLKGRVAEGN